VRGAIHADFTSVTGESFALNVRLPANVEAVVFLPRLGGDSPDIVMDGKRTAGTIEGEFVVLDGVGSGDHRFERTK